MLASGISHFYSVDSALIVVDNQNDLHRYDFSQQSLERLTAPGFQHHCCGTPQSGKDYLMVPGRRSGALDYQLLAYSPGQDTLNVLIDVDPDRYQVRPAPELDRYLISDGLTKVFSSDGTKEGTALLVDLEAYGVEVSEVCWMDSTLIIVSPLMESLDAVISLYDLKNHVLDQDRFVVRPSQSENVPSMYQNETDVFFVGNSDDTLSLIRWSLRSEPDSKKIFTADRESEAWRNDIYLVSRGPTYLVFGAIKNDLSTDYYFYDFYSDSLMLLFTESAFLRQDFQYTSEIPFYPIGSTQLIHRYTELEGNQWWRVSAGAMLTELGHPISKRFGAHSFSPIIGNNVVFFFTSGLSKADALWKMDAGEEQAEIIMQISGAPFHLPSVVQARFKDDILCFSEVDHTGLEPITRILKYDVSQDNIDTLMNGPEFFI